MEFDRFTLVLLRWPDGMREFTEEELARSQSGHLAFLDEMRERGVLLASGPFDDQPDERLRGVSIYTSGLEETRRLLEGDPAVQLGRLEPEAVSWLVPRGTLRGD